MIKNAYVIIIGFLFILSQTLCNTSPTQHQNKNKAKTVSGQLLEGNMMIQNYGNQMNEYHFFKDCDEKYLELIKT